MTTKEISEGCRTIAAYDGWELIKLPAQDPNYRYPTYGFRRHDEPTSTITGSAMEHSTLPYDTQMNWLYPVACKVMAELEPYKDVFSIKPGGAEYYLYFKCLFGQPIDKIFEHTFMAIEFLNKQKK